MSGTKRSAEDDSSKKTEVSDETAKIASPTDDGVEDNSNKKVKLNEPAENSSPEDDGLGSVVAAHYNTIEEKGLKERNKSRIVYLRNFNNWVKSMLINEYLAECKKNPQYSDSITVLDMGCGKGGDLLKWRNNNIKHLICVDLAAVSVEQCETRYKDMQERNARSRHPPIFSAEFIVADCTKVRLKDSFKNKDQLLDIVSCQFAFHYSFESLVQAECMIQNAAESLRPGGYFIGTIPDANDIVMRQRQSGTDTFGNEVFRVKFNCDVKQRFPFFGAQYEFFLEDVVNCPEFLVHFPTLIKLAKNYGLKFLMKERFHSFFKRMKDEGRGLLGRMQTMETYPAFEETPLQGKPEEYIHADNYLKEHPNTSRVGTLSQSEWEAISLYMVFAFVKEDS